MTNQEFYDNCNKEIMYYIKEGVKEYERERKESIYNRFKSESDADLIIKAVQAYELMYEGDSEEWCVYVETYNGTPTGKVFRCVGELFDLIQGMKYKTKRDVFYHICKIIGGE